MVRFPPQNRTIRFAPPLATFQHWMSSEVVYLFALNMTVQEV